MEQQAISNGTEIDQLTTHERLLKIDQLSAVYGHARGLTCINHTQPEYVAIKDELNRLLSEQRRAYDLARRARQLEKIYE